MVLELREAPEFCIEIFLAFEPAINGTPCTGREINERQVALPHQLVNRPVSFGKQIAQFHLRPLRGDARQTIANSARGTVVTFSEARREDQYSFFHSLSGHRNANGKLASRGKEDGSIRSLMDICIGQSKLSVQMKYLGFLWRVLRRLVWETATDTTTGLAAQMAYLLLFALAPGSLFLWHLLGLFGTDPTKLHRMFLLLKSFMPPDPKVQDILDSAMANVVVTGSSGLLANAGIILGIYCGTVFIATTSRALSHTYGIREDRHWWSKYIISFFMLFWFGIIIVFCFNAIVFGERLAGLAEVNFQLAFPLQAWIATLNLPFTFVALVILALALYLLTPENYLTVRQALPGAIFFSVGWIIATKLFQLYVARYDRYNPTYLALASIVVLLTWMYLTCLLLLLGGKLNAILRREGERMRAAAPAAPEPAPTS
jgi:membrane protein